MWYKMKVTKFEINDVKKPFRLKYKLKGLVILTELKC
jgi:hypothetical protein